MPTPPKPAHVPALDGLRGAAVAAVVAFHLGYLEGGYLGVDLFFTLSGFLITRLLIAEHQSTGGIALGAFLGRRARRLMPALLVMLAGVALVTNAWGSTSDWYTHTAGTFRRHGRPTVTHARLLTGDRTATLAAPRAGPDSPEWPP